MRIYFDENFSHRIASGMREFQMAKPSEGISVIWTPDEFGKGAKDEEWIPLVASKHGIVLTQDLKIHRTQAQWELCSKNKIGVFFFKPPKAGWNHWIIVREVVNRWEEIKQMATQKRPFGYVIEHRKTKLKALH
jgi:PIN like domain